MHPAPHSYDIAELWAAVLTVGAAGLLFGTAVLFAIRRWCRGRTDRLQDRSSDHYADAWSPVPDELIATVPDEICARRTSVGTERRSQVFPFLTSDPRRQRSRGFADSPDVGAAISMATEEVLGRILRDLRETTTEEHETTMVRCLAEVGRLLDVDRCYYHSFADESRGLSSQRHWCAPGAPPMSGDEWSLGLARAPWLQTRLRDEGALVIADLRSVEPGDVPERERWLRQGLSSLLVVPIRENGELAGLIGCETLGRVRRWNAHDRWVLETVADVCRYVRHHEATSRHLAQANDRVANLAEVMAEPVAVVDPGGRVVVWNVALAKLSGIVGATAHGRVAAELVETFLPGCGEYLSKQIQSPAAQSCAPVTSTIVKMTAPDGEPVWAQLLRRPLKNEAGEILHFCDVTAAKREESRMRAHAERLERAVASQQAELEQAQRQLVESEKMAAVARLVTGLAREIDVPVTGSREAASHLAALAVDLERGYRDGLMQRSDFEEFFTAARESSRLIHDDLQRATDLLATMRRAAAGRARDLRRRIQLKEYLDDVLLNLRPQLLERHVSVRLTCPDDFSVEAEPDVIYRIVSNLVVNAAQHAFTHMATGAIRIDVVPLADRVLIRFTDNGCGIRGDHLSRIYEPFFTTTRDRGSLGLGLHVVYNLVTRNLGGRLQCMSGAGEGTVFDIEFPIEKDMIADDKPCITAGA